jgi:hypothetical protein
VSDASVLQVRHSEIDRWIAGQVLTIIMDKREASAPKQGRSIPIES